MALLARSCRYSSRAERSEMVMGGERVLILSCDHWRMVDEKTGVSSEGYSVWYVNEYREDTPASFGLKPTKMLLRDQAMADSLRGLLPCVAEASMSSRPGAQNKAVSFFRAINVVSPSVDVLQQVSGARAAA
jgi:hypothetical protein